MVCWPNKPSVWIPFDVGMGITQKLYCGHRLHPIYALRSCLDFRTPIFDYICHTVTSDCCVWYLVHLIQGSAAVHCPVLCHHHWCSVWEWFGGSWRAEGCSPGEPVWGSVSVCGGGGLPRPPWPSHNGDSTQLYRQYHVKVCMYGWICYELIKSNHSYFQA